MGREKKRELEASLCPNSHPVPRALFFSLPSLPTTQRGRGERTIGTRSQRECWENKTHLLYI